MNFLIRTVQSDDYHRGHLELYKQLSKINPENISYEKYENFINKLNEAHMIFVIEEENKIIATITILIEEKLLRNISKVGHIEDVVVDSNYRKFGLGKKLIKKIVEYCKEKSCYKIILNCSEHNKGFYEKCDFENKEIEMVMYLDK